MSYIELIELVYGAQITIGCFALIGLGVTYNEY